MLNNIDSDVHTMPLWFQMHQLFQQSTLTNWLPASNKNSTRQLLFGTFFSLNAIDVLMLLVRL